MGISHSGKDRETFGPKLSGVRPNERAIAAIWKSFGRKG